MKQLAVVFGLAIALAIGLPQIFGRGNALAAIEDPVAQQSDATAIDQNQPPKPWIEQKFAGSYFNIGSFVGTGTFYTRYSDPYVSSVVALRPIYQLGTKRKLSLNARLYGEVEFTQPDNPEARRFYPLDTWIWLAAKNLYTEPRSKIRIGGLARLILPTSYESRYAHLLAGLVVGGSASREFTFGRPDAQGKPWKLTLGLGSAFTKNLHSSALRGNGPGDSTGCLAPAALQTEASAAGPGASTTDRCGGPLNTNFSVLSSGSVTLNRGRWELAVNLIIINDFRYSVPVDAFSSTDVPLGRQDTSWGAVALTYELTQRYGISGGVNSVQPALDARQRYPRFPFFDLSGANANNYTQFFLNFIGTI